MAKTRAPIRIFAILTFALTMSAAAHAQAARTRVSRAGDDVNHGLGVEGPNGAAEMHVGASPRAGTGDRTPF
ncbi:MAG: hypothetical protein ABW250_10700 [Pyrinomonadaceae bacterium]